MLVVDIHWKLSTTKLCCFTLPNPPPPHPTTTINILQSLSILCGLGTYCKILLDCNEDQSCEIGGKICGCIVKTDCDCDNRLWNQKDREESLSVVKKWKYKWFRWKAIECFIILSLKVDSFGEKLECNMESCEGIMLQGLWNGTVNIWMLPLLYLAIILSLS